MDYTLQNEVLALRVSGHGGEMKSILTKDGTEYLWQGNPQYWKGQAPNLFPFIGRLADKRYTIDGKTYSMNIHGFFRDFDLEAKQSDDCLALTLQDNQETWAVYPRAFRASLIYRLKGNTIEITMEVENTGDKTMYFAYGGHPGFNVPLTQGKAFEDYYLEFSKPCQPRRVGLSTSALVEGPWTPYALEDDQHLPLRHNLFDNDAVVLTDMDRTVSIRCKDDSRGVTVSFPQMPFVGFWHMSDLDAPYLCIEPWSSLPARQDVIEAFETKEDMISLEPGKIYQNTWSITIH